MAAPTNFIEGIVSLTISGIVPTAILRIRYNDETQLNGEGYDDDTSDTHTWGGANRGSGTVEGRDPEEIMKVKNIGPANLVAVFNNTKTAGKDRTVTFTNARFAQPGGDVAGGKGAPGTFSINFRYGALTDADAAAE